MFTLMEDFMGVCLLFMEYHYDVVIAIVFSNLSIYTAHIFCFGMNVVVIKMCQNYSRVNIQGFKEIYLLFLFTYLILSCPGLDLGRESGQYHFPDLVM